jgi:hypothetical protein
MIIKIFTLIKNIIKIFKKGFGINYLWRKAIMEKILRVLVIALTLIITLSSVSAGIISKTEFGDTKNPKYICEIRKNIDSFDIDYEYIDRDKIIEIAEEYVNYEWYPTIDNIFHGECPICGQKVDTSDRDYFTQWYDFWGWKSGQLNIGIPYKAGGFSSISGLNLTNPEDFYEQYTGTGSYQGVIHYAGDVYLDKHYACLRACGVDCSGFVSRCWNLPQKHCTFPYPDYPFGLQNASSPIRFEELKPGDLLNCPKYHAILFKEFVDEDTIIIIDAGGLAWQVAEYPCDVTFVSDNGFNIRLKGTYHNLTYDFSKQLFGPRQYNYISNTPMTPTIEGPTTGIKGDVYNYSFNTTDPNEDDVNYIVEWGDDQESIGPYPSGESITVNHTWSKRGTFYLRVKAKDSSGLESGWSEFRISIPRFNARNIKFQTLFRILENFPILHRFLMIV